MTEVTSAASGAEQVADALYRHGVQTIFTLSGNQILPLHEALRTRGVRLLSTRHEAAAVHMADAWGQLTGRAGVALVTAGPGHGNTLTALAVTRGNESPVLLLSGATETTARGTHSFQELPQVELAALVAKWATSADDPATAGHLVAAALECAEAPIPGPVSVSLPFDVQTATAFRVPGEMRTRSDSKPPGSPLLPADRRGGGGAAHHPIPPGGGSSGRTGRPTGILDLVGVAQAPLLLGSPWVARQPAFRAAAEMLGAPAFALESPRAGSDPILYGSEAAFARADLVVLLAPWDYLARTPSILRPRRLGILQIWPTPPPIPLPDGMRHVTAAPVDALHDMLRLPIPAATAAQTARAEQEAARAAVARDARAQPIDGVHPLRLADAVRRRLTGDDVVALDGGEFCQWIRLGLAWGPWRTLLNGKFGPIGTTVPHALGARTALGDEPAVVGFAGDGGFGYHAMEIETAARERLSAILIVGTDGKWGAEWHLQRRRYGPDRTVASELSVARYEDLARGLGGIGLRLDEEAAIEPTLDTAWQAMRDGHVVLINALIPPLASPAALH